MKLRLKHYVEGKLVELIVSGFSATLTEDITNLKGEVDENFIQNLRSIADELEEHNQKLK